ncbi:MAG: winged helix-turn-helix domain-containing protein [Chloroflexi bacterium]|nr:winged helix-turn-helix domain-containing protein [Chloroflexota bacterium]
MPDKDHPLTFRKEIFQPLTDSIRAGESCALVGVGSSGKSNIARFMRDREDARQKYFGEMTDRVLWLMVDCNALDNYEETSLYTAMIDSLVRELSKREDAAKASTLLDNLLRETVTFRHLQRAVEAVRAAADYLIVFVLDDCDALIASAQPVLLRRLRALRDEFKTKLMYVTVTRRELHLLRPPSPEFETFYEIIVVRTFAVGPYSFDDAAFMLNRLASRLPQPRKLDHLEISRLIEVTGGHAGLLRASFYATRAGEEALESNLIETLIVNAGVMDEARKIWESVESFEQDGLLAVVSGKAIKGAARDALLARGLIRESTDDSQAIFCAVFEAFVAQKANVPLNQLSFARMQAEAKGVPEIRVYGASNAKRVRVGDKLVEGFNRVELELLQLLVEKRGHEVTRAELLESALAAETESPTGWGKIDQVVDRAIVEIRKKIEPSHTLRPYIVSTPNGGYKLSDL